MATRCRWLLIKHQPKRLTAASSRFWVRGICGRRWSGAGGDGGRSDAVIPQAFGRLRLEMPIGEP
jgi:hypothetical protein